MKGFSSSIEYGPEDSCRGTYWNDLNLFGLSLGTGGATVPDLITLASTNIKLRGFIGSGLTVQEGWGSLELVHDYKENTDIIPHVHWVPQTATAGDVKWQLEYVWLNRDGVASIGTVISVTVAAGGTAWLEKRTSFSAISGSGKGIGSRFTFRLFRDPADAADTYIDYAGLLDFGIHYERDTAGSRGVTTK